MKAMDSRAQGKAQAAAKAMRLRKGCNAAMGAKTRFHVSIFPGCSISVVLHA
ncbi:hypothetical protein [Polaromonas jejuensis]|uniref:hypothetical protein n=1 Tax=Polaromonas jejuensis TaxID=457502 RepID=UPI00147114EE